MKKRFLSLFVAIATFMSLLGGTAMAVTEDLTDCFLSGYSNKNINNSYIDSVDGFTLTNVQDATTGVYTSTVAMSGTLQKGKRVGTFQPWKGDKSTDVMGSGKPAYTMHFGVTISEISHEVYYRHQHYNSSGGGGPKDLMYLSPTKVTSIETKKSVAVTVPYDINVFMNTQTGYGYIYVNDTLLAEGNLNPSNYKRWNQIRMFSNEEESPNFKLVTTNGIGAMYNESVTLNEVVSYVMKGTSDGAVYPDGCVKDVSEYGASTYTANYYVPGSSGSGSVTWTDSGSRVYGGTHTQTATLADGKTQVDAGQNAIGVGGGTKNIYLKNNNNYGAKTLHCRYTFVESSSPIQMRFQYYTSGGDGSYSLPFIMTNTGVTLNDNYGGGSISATAPYDINIFQNVESGATVIYVNNQILLDQRETAATTFGNSSYNWNQFRFVTTVADTAFKLVIQNMHHEVYDEKVLLSDVIDYVMLEDKSQAYITDYWWSIDGIKTDWKQIQGAMDGVCSVTGDNTNGYVITPNSIDANNYGFARYFLGSDDKDPIDQYSACENAVLHQSFEYQPTSLTTGHEFRIRGNNGYANIFTVEPKTGSEAAYISVGGNRIYLEDETSFHKIDFIADVKNYDYYLLVDGKVRGTGSITAARQPLWQTAFVAKAEGESMTIRKLNTKVYDTANTSIEVLDSVRTKTGAIFATDTNGYGNFEVENYANCYDADAWRIYNSTRLFSNNSSVAVIRENKTAPGAYEYPTLNLSFTGNKSGTNTYYMWIRHTASVANSSGKNFYLSKTENGDYTTFTLSAEQTAPTWICLGTVSVDAGGTGYVRIRHRQQNHIAIDRYVISTDPSFTPTDAYYGITPANNSTAVSIAASSFKDGRASLEAEDTTWGSPFEGYSRWSHYSTYGGSGNFSGSDGIITSSKYEIDFTETWTTDPHIEFNFTAPTSGTKYLWVRMNSTTVNKAIAISVNYAEYSQFKPTVAEDFYWQRIAVIDGVQANLKVNVRLYNVTGGYALDTFAITDSAFDVPSGKNVTWTDISADIANPYSAPTVTAATVTAMQHPRIYFTSSEVATVKASLSASENTAALAIHNANVAAGKNNNFTGTLAVTPGTSNNNPEFLGTIESLAFAYAVNGDDVAGPKAVSSLMNFISTVSYAGKSSEDLTNEAGHDIGTIAKIYDWCYPLMTEDQKTAVIDHCIGIMSQLSVSWPPSGLSAITGIGSEGIFQEYILSFAIAVANERPDIYNFVLGRMQDEYIPAKKELYAGGKSLQGSRYGTYRGQHELAAALLLDTIGYADYGYGAGLEDLANWYIYARRPDGLMFIDGDDSNDGKTAGEFYSVGHMRNALVIASRLFENPYIKNEARKATNDFSEFQYYGNGYMSATSFLAINRTSIGTTIENGYPLTKYFDSPAGNLIARTGWPTSPATNDDTAVAYMKTGEVNISNHQHLDAGSFQLYYKGILANDPCYYTGTNYSSDYMNYYARRSVAHNTVLVRDGVERSLNGRSVADGGQVPLSAPTAVNGITQVATTEAYDFGGDDINHPDYSYLKADLTNAYASASVSDYNRSFMFLNMYDADTPAALVVFDRLVTKNTAHKTAWLLHGLKAPTINGKRATFTLGENGYTGKMTNDTLLPASASITSVQDGYLTAGGTYYNSGYTGTTGVNESAGYRIEVSPTSQSTTTYYLNVVQVGEGDSTAYTPVLIENNTFAGALIKDRVVLFSKSGDLIGATTGTEYSFNFTENEGYLCKIAIADVTEGTWNISYSEDGSSYEVIATASTNRMGDDKGATIQFLGRGGYYKISRASGTYTTLTSEICETNSIKQLTPGVKIKDNTIYVAPRTYDAQADISNGTYSYKQIVSIYDYDQKKLIGVKIFDFTDTDNRTEYGEVKAFTEALPETVTTKTLLFRDFNTIEAITKDGMAEYK